MPVPSSITDLSTTPSSNGPAGSEAPSSIDDYQRALAAIVRQVYDAQQSTNSADAAAIALKAPLASPALTGTPTAPTATAGDNSTKIATTAYADASASASTAIAIAAATDVSNHETAADPHPGYMRRGVSAPVTASGVAVDFAGVPSWAKRISIVANGLSTNGSSPPIIQVGAAGSPQNSGYGGTVSALSSGVSTVALSDGFRAYTVGAASNVFNWQGDLVLLDAATNLWAFRSQVGFIGATASGVCQGVVTLSGDLDIVRFTTQGGSDVFDSGTVSIMYEG